MYEGMLSKTQTKSKSKARCQRQPLYGVTIPGVRNPRKAAIRTASSVPAILTEGHQLVVNETVVMALTSDEERRKDEKGSKETRSLRVTDVKVSFRYI